MNSVHRIVLCLLASVGFASAANVTVTPSTTYQNIDGFGAGAVYYTGWVPAHPSKAAIYDTMFTGLGLSYLRLGNWNQDSTSSLAADSEIVAEGRKRLGDRFKILMSSWGAPGYLKASGSVKGSPNGTLLSRSQNTLKKVNGNYVYAEFAHWWKRSLVRYASKGIVPTVVSLQNEPDMNAEYEETLFDATENDSIAGYPQVLQAVHDSLATLSQVPQIYGPEVLGIGYNNFTKYANAMNKNLVDGYNYHLYHGSTGGAYVNPEGFSSTLKTITSSFTGKPFMMSEYCPMRSAHPDSDMIVLARLIYTLLTDGNVSSYINWELIWGDGGQMVQVDNPWSTKTWSVNPEYHGMRHFSRFTGPGWKRIAATSDDASVRSVAFRSSDADSVTLVVINVATSSKTLNFAATGYGKVSDAWQSTVNGSKSARLTVASTATSLSLPAQSITTVVFLPTTATSSSSQAISSSSVSPSSSSSVPLSSSSSVAQAPYTTAIVLPGTIQMEDYDIGGEGSAYHDTDATNSGNVYRTDGVDLDSTGDGGLAIGWTITGEWTEYTVHVSSAGPLLFDARVASGGDAGKFHLELDGSAITSSVTVPNTGSWSTYQTVSGTTQNMSAGTHVLRFVVEGSYFNIDWIQFTDPNVALHPFQMPASENGLVYRIYNIHGAPMGFLQVGNERDLQAAMRRTVPQSGIYFVRSMESGASYRIAVTR